MSRRSPRSSRQPRVFPLSEVFGFPETDFSNEAKRYRSNGWCPFNNPTGPNCTKDSIIDPLGVCSVYHSGHAIITCPVRFRQNWRIIEDAARFFFPNRPKNSPLPRALSEVALRDGHGNDAGNIDLVLLDLAEDGSIRDYGALEIQAVYISGAVRPLFKHYMEQQEDYQTGWPTAKYPRPDYLSSSRKRLAPQLLYKGTLLNHWNRKIAVAVQREFFATMPTFVQVDPADADFAWLIYDLEVNPATNQYELQPAAIQFTHFKETLATFTLPPLIDELSFLSELQRRVSTGQTAPDTLDLPTLFEGD